MPFFVWFCAKYVWPPFVSIMEERKKRIADGLEAASKAEKNLESAQAKSEEQLKLAKTDAAAIIDQANKTDTPVSVCGEIAGDPIGAILLMGMGYKKLSMNAASLLKIKAVIRETNLKFAQELVEKIIEVDDEAIIQAIIKAELKRSGMNLKHFGIREN